jgi:hypothetical protein
MPRKLRWYDPLPEVTAVIDCGGEPHRVSWRRGKVVLEAHDLGAERTMLVFGGELCQCMRVLEMWVKQFKMPPELYLQMHTWLGQDAYLLPEELALPRRLSMILSWERAWKFEAWLHTKQMELIATEIKEKALPALRQHVTAWKAKTGARVIASCQVALVPANRPSGVEGSTDRVAMRATARLHPRWLVDISPRGIAVVDDAFVLEVLEQETLDDLRVIAVRWEPKGAGAWGTVGAPARLHHADDDAWHLTWDAA